MKIERVFHPHTKCEEFSAGMWRNVFGEERAQLIFAAAELMCNPKEFREAMIEAVNLWPNSCEQNLIPHSINHRAWIGHAGCCVRVNSPEDVTRLAWHTLNIDEQFKANAAADEAIAYWREHYLEKKCRKENLELMF